MCEDYPCCGHEYGDCEGQLYGTSEDIWAREQQHREMEELYGFDPEW